MKISILYTKHIKKLNKSRKYKWSFFWKPKKLNNVTLYNAHFTDFIFDKHVHDDFSITLLDEGETNFFYKGFNYKFTKHTIFTLTKLFI